MKKSYSAKIALVFLTLIYIVNFVDRQIVAVVAPLLKTEFVLSNTEIGLIYGSLFSVFYALSGIPLGRLSDQISRKKLILTCLFIWSLATFLGGWISTIFQLIGLRILVAIAESGASPAAYSLISDLFPQKEWSARISFYASGIFIGIGSAFLLGGVLVEAVNWRDAFMYAGILGLVLAIVAVWFIPDVPQTNSKPKKLTYAEWLSNLRQISSIKAIRYHLLGFTFLALSGYALLSFLSTILQNLGRPDLIKHYGWFLFGVAGMIIGSGYWADFLAKKGKYRRFIPAIAAAWLGLPLYWLGLSSVNGLTAFLLIGTGALLASSYNGVAASLIQQLAPPELRGFTSGIYLFMISIGGFGLGPFLTGFIADTFFSGPNSIQLSLRLVMTICGILGGLALIKAMKESRETP